MALAAAPEPTITVAAPGFQLVNVDPNLSDFYTNHLAQQLSFRGVRTVTTKDTAALLGFERQRQLLGCPDDVCRLQLTKQLGVDGLLVGTITRLGNTYRLDVRILATEGGAPIAGASSESGDNDRLVGTFTLVADQLAKQVSEKLNRPLVTSGPTEVSNGPSLAKRLSWIPAGVGAIGLGVGVGMLFAAKGTNDRLNQTGGTALTTAQANALVSSGYTQQTVGFVSLGVGIAAVAAAAGMFFFGGDEIVHAGVALAPGQTGIVITGVLP